MLNGLGRAWFAGRIACAFGLLDSAAAASVAAPVIADTVGTVTQKAFASASLKHELAYLLYLPPGYDPAAASRYPVLYLLHGRGGKMAAWTNIKTDLDRLISTGRIPPVIAIMPDAPASRRAGYYIDSQFTGSADPKLPPGEPVETAFTQDLIAHVDATYPTRTDRNGRIVAGYSMGGYGALRYSLAHPELFGAAIVLSPAVYFPLPPPDSSTREFGAFGRGARQFDDEVYTALNYPATIPAFAAKGLPLIMFIAVGDDEAALANPAEASHDLDYEAHTLYNKIRRVPHITSELRVINGPHDWATWRPTFIEGVEHVFAKLHP
jgi:enterochelin esterase-like enzyme